MKIIYLLTLKLMVVLATLFGIYWACFHYGWGMNVYSWSWVLGCWWAAIFAAGGFALPIWKTPFLMAVKTAIYLATVFCLSCWAIIYGWGMSPRNWWLVIIPYSIAACMPPFDTVSKYLLFWRKDIDPVMQALADLHNATDAYMFGERTQEEQTALADALENARVIAARGGV
jgi:hypothetical protein